MYLVSMVLSYYHILTRLFIHINRQQKLKEALADLTAALSHNPSNENALTQRAKLNMRMGRCAEAESDFQYLKQVSKPVMQSLGRYCNHTHTPYSIHHTPYTIYHTPYIIHHTPYTIYHIPYTIYHIPYTIYHTPYT
ncbi:tetratricopeptide repeat protein, partial [archaeon]